MTPPTISNPPRSDFVGLPQLVVRPTAIILALLLVIYGLFGYCVHYVAAKLEAVTLSAIETQWFIVLFGAGYLGLSLIHELGHVAAYRALGMRWERLTIGLSLSVSSFGTRTHRAQFLISIAGPAAQIIAAVILTLTTGTPWSLFGVLGLFGLIDGAGNLAIPFGKNSDAVKMYRSAWATIRGRGGELTQTKKNKRGQT